MPQDPAEHLELIAPLRRTDSGAGTFLALASDGNQYWVKVSNNPQGVKTLAAEVVIHAVGRLIGAPVRDTALIDIPAGLDWRPTKDLRLEEGVAHGSLDLAPAIVSDEWRTYSAQDDNRSRQARLLGLWDLCMGGDPQWLHDVANAYSIWSFDHGFWLGGDGYWSKSTLERIGMTPWQYDLDLDVASAVALRAAASALRALDRGQISAATGMVPIEWQISLDDLNGLADILYLRAEGVANRLEAAASNARHQ